MCSRWLKAVGLAAVIAVTGPALAAGQAAPAQPYKAPLTADGQPDIQGVSDSKG